MTPTEAIELAGLRALEKCVRTMFDFSGWQDDVDDDAAEAVEEVEVALRWLKDTRQILGIKTAPDVCASGGPT